jgi:hypothetical protein
MNFNMKTLKEVQNTYYLPTPVLWRKIGDSLLLLGSTLTGISAFTMPPIVTAIAAGLTFVGKVITNFATK